MDTNRFAMGLLFLGMVILVTGLIVGFVRMPKAVAVSLVMLAALVSTSAIIIIFSVQDARQEHRATANMAAQANVGSTELLVKQSLEDTTRLLQKLEDDFPRLRKHTEDAAQESIDVVKKGGCEAFERLEAIIALSTKYVGKLSDAKASFIQGNDRAKGLAELLRDEQYIKKTLEIQTKGIQQFTLHREEMLTTLNRIRLDFADAALIGNCFKIAEFEYRQVMEKADNQNFSARASAGIQNVLDRQKR